MLLLGCCVAPALYAQAVPPLVAAPLKAAQEKPKEEPPAAGGGAEMAVVSVVAERPTDKFDRQVYDVKQDNTTGNQSLADTLNNVPAVTVDPDGTVALRGNQNVQIMVDGKPSALFQGENRGNMLNSLPSDNYETIEVINNPGPEFGNEGGGGPVLNLVSRRNRRAGGGGNVSANVGSGERYNSAVNGHYSEGLWNYEGGMNYRKNVFSSDRSSWRERIGANGEVNRSSSEARGLSEGGTFSGFGKGDYNVGAKDRMGAAFTYSRTGTDSANTVRSIDYRTGTVPYSEYVSEIPGTAATTMYSWGGYYLHAGQAPGQQFRLDLRVSSNTSRNDSTTSNTYLVHPSGRPAARSFRTRENGNKVVDLSGDYDVGNALKMGFKFAETKGIFDTGTREVNPVTGLEEVVVSRTNMFDMDEGNLAAYASYAPRLGKWGIRSGVRAEYTMLDIEQVTSRIRAKNNYLTWIPSLVVQYDLGEAGVVKFNYARRIRRPQSNDLNPYVVYRDDFNVSSGNPQLKPVATDLFEVSREDMRWFGLRATARAYFRRESDDITDRRYFISDSVLLTTRENFGHRKASGVELSLNGRILPTLNVLLYGRLGRDEQRSLAQQASLAGAGKVSSTALSGRVNLRYLPGLENTFTLMLSGQGRQLGAQGYTEPRWFANAGWSHKLDPRLSMKLDISDVFESNKYKRHTDTEFLREFAVSQSQGRTVSFGLSYQLGGVTGNTRRNQFNPGDGPRPGAGSAMRGGS